MNRGVQKELRANNFSEWISGREPLPKAIDLVRSTVLSLGLPEVITDSIKNSLAKYKG